MGQVFGHGIFGSYGVTGDNVILMNLWYSLV